MQRMTSGSLSVPMRGPQLREVLRARMAAFATAVSEDWLAVYLGLFLIACVVAGPSLAWPTTEWATGRQLLAEVFVPANLLKLLLVGAPLLLLAVGAAAAMRLRVPRFMAGFTVLFLLAWLGQVLAGYTGVRAWGLEYVIFALAIGLAIGNFLAVPGWLAEAARTEFYIKTGLVLLGASIVFGDLWQAGVLGIAQGIMVVLAVWTFSFWLSTRLRVDEELSVMLATAVSICGVSAAIAACGAIQGDRKKLSYVTSLVLIVAAPMMIAMPPVVAFLGLPEIVAGAWLGGTLDTSASVVAAGESVGPAARNAGVIVKLSQNVLIGVAAFFLTLWWMLRRGDVARSPGLRVIWQRFPKFVLGFLLVSLLFSAFLDGSTVARTKGTLGGLRTMWFALAFTSIGLETRFAELVRTGQGRPALSFLGAQAFNIAWTLLLAFLFFGGVLFPAPTFSQP